MMPARPDETHHASRLAVAIADSAWQQCVRHGLGERTQAPWIEREACPPA
jgi:hypothetical protein